MNRAKGLFPLLILLLAALAAPSVLPAERLRLIVETDAGGDPDDEQSLVRFFLYLNEWDVEGIMATRPKTRSDNPNPLPDGLMICRSFVQAYREVYPCLSTHAQGYPAPDSLWAVTVAGYDNVDDGVELILREVDSPDPRPVWFSNWGTDDSTTSNLRRALDRVLVERGPDGYARFKQRIRLCSDDKFGRHATGHAPPWNLWVYTKMPDMDGGRWYHRFSPLTARAGGFDIDRDVRQGHGPLGVLYAVTAGKTGEPQKEGDTPEFLYLIPTGMNDAEHPDWGSWGGRYGVRRDSAYGEQWNYYWANQRDSLDGSWSRDNTLSRWAVQLQNDFRARMDWCVKPYAGANHPPAPCLQGDVSREILYLDVKPCETLTLSAAGSRDPDGDSLSFRWVCYPEAGTYGRNASITGSEGPQCSVTIPPDAAGKTIHIILICSDNGEPTLTRYRRAVLTVTAP